MDQENSLNREVWTDLARNWAVLVPPLRPSQGEIAIYERLLQNISSKVRKPKALLLGATPELRDLLAKCRINTTIVDINPNMVRGMAELLEYSTGKEEVVTSNWLNIPLKAGQFDVILCDHGMHHIFFEEWDKFFEEMKRLLKPDGHMINSFVTVEEAEKISNEEVMEIYRSKFFSREDKWYYIYRNWLYQEDVEGKKYYKICADIEKGFEKMLRENKITQAQYDFFRLPPGIVDFKAVMAPKEAVDEVTARHFTIKSVNVSFEHPVFTCHKIYFAKVNK